MSYGFSEISRDIAKVFTNAKQANAHPLVPLPSSGLGKVILEYATTKLPPKVLNHSLRVFQYSVAIIKDQFPQWELDSETIFVTCLLHDIGTTTENMKASKMSFEFYGGIVARDLVLQETKGNKEYADAVSEAIIRHQDLGETGNITLLGFILQVSTILDNVGKNDYLVHRDTLDAINKKYPRDGWLDCFAGVVDTENKEKPWGHTSSLGLTEFRDSVLANKTKYEKL